MLTNLFLGLPTMVLCLLLQSINGVIMIGVSTSALMAVIQDVWQKHNSRH